MCHYYFTLLYVMQQCLGIRILRLPHLKRAFERARRQKSSS